MGGLADGTTVATAGTLQWDDPGAILAWLDAYDPNSLRVMEGDADDLTQSQADRLAAALAAFVGALSAVAPPRRAPPAAPNPARTPSSSWRCTRCCVGCAVRRVSGCAITATAAWTCGPPPAPPWVPTGCRSGSPPGSRDPTGCVLILADVSLSVRPVTAFVLRMAQAIRRRTNRCEVFAFVDRPVDVTDALLTGAGDTPSPGSSPTPRSTSRRPATTAGCSPNCSPRPSSLGEAHVRPDRRDGRSGGRPDGAEDLAELCRRVHRLAWVTPESERYWGQATCAMTTYREHCDGVVVARDAEQLIERARDLGNALRVTAPTRSGRCAPVRTGREAPGTSL